VALLVFDWGSQAQPAVASLPVVKISRYSKIALASSTRVRQRRWSSSSTRIRDQNASIIELS
jgi:hypothetical protein